MIKSISMRNFRGTTERIVEFGAGATLIKGPNEIGKSTISEAISFAFYGVDSFGTKNPDHLIMDGSDVAEVALQTDKATFIRRKKRGGTSTVQVVREGYPELKMTQTELTKLLQMDFDLFASCYKVGYFMKLPDSKRKEVISQAWKFDRKALLNEMVQSNFMRLVKLENPRLDSQAVARERQMLQQQKASDEGALLFLNAQSQEVGEQLNEGEVEQELKRLSAEVALHDMYERDLRAYQSAAQSYAEREAQSKVRLAERERIQLEIGALGERSLYDSSESNIKYENLMAEARALALKPIPAPPNLPNVYEGGATCSRCGQHVSDKMVAQVKEERDRLVMEFNALERQVADENALIEQKRKSFEKQAQDIAADNIRRCRAVDEWKNKMAQLEFKLKQNEPLLNSAPPKAPDAPSGYHRPVGIKGPKELHSDFQAKLQAYRMLKHRSEGSRDRAVQLEHSIMDKTTSIDDLARLEEALKKLPEIEVSRTMENFSLQSAKISFSEGEIQVTDARDVPYASLSDGRRMKMDLEWAKCFQRLKGELPGFYFVDNADLVDSFQEWLPVAQVFLAKVDPTIRELQIVQL